MIGSNPIFSTKAPISGPFLLTFFLQLGFAYSATQVYVCSVKQRLVYITAHILLFIFALGVIEPLFASLKVTGAFEYVADSQANSEKEATEKENSTKEKELSSNLFYVQTESFFMAEIRYAHSHPSCYTDSHPGYSTLPELPPKSV